MLLLSVLLLQLQLQRQRVVVDEVGSVVVWLLPQVVVGGIIHVKRALKLLRIVLQDVVATIYFPVSHVAVVATTSHVVHVFVAKKVSKLLMMTEANEEKDFVDGD